MESNLNSFINSMEVEHNSLTDQITGLESEVVRLTHENAQIKKALDKQKVFHRNFADEVDAMEQTRIRDFKEEKRSLLERNKSLIQLNRQLQTDATFYKQAYEELAKESREAVNLGQGNNETFDSPSPPVTTKRIMKKVVNSTKPASSKSQSVTCDCKLKSSKVLTKVNDKLFIESKKLKSKISTLTATISVLKKQNKQLQGFQEKIDKKRMKHTEDSAELERLVATTRMKNKETFNVDTLRMLRELTTFK